MPNDRYDEIGAHNLTDNVPEGIEEVPACPTTEVIFAKAKEYEGYLHECKYCVWNETVDYELFFCRLPELGPYALD